MIQRMDLVPLVYPANHHHADQNLEFTDMSWIACKERLDCEWPVCLNHHIDPGSGDIDTRQFVDDLVDLHDDNSIVKGGRLDYHRRIFRIGSGVKVALSMRLFGANKNDIGNQIDQQSHIEFNVGMNGTDVELAVFQQLRPAQPLRTGKGEIHLLCNPQLKQCEVFRTADARDDQVQVVHFLRIDLHEGPRKKISLLLVVAFKYNPVSADDEAFECLDHLRPGQDRAFHPVLNLLHTPLFLVAPRRPGTRYLS